jgi:hypothetical protein
MTIQFWPNDPYNLLPVPHYIYCTLHETMYYWVILEIVFLEHTVSTVPFDRVPYISVGTAQALHNVLTYVGLFL